MASSRTLAITKDARIATSGGTDMGAGASDFLPYGVYSGYTYRALLQATLNWTGVVKIVSATLHIKVSSQHYVAFSSDPDVKAQRLASAWSEGTSVDLSTGNAVTWANQPAAFSSDESPASDMSTTEGTWETIDLTDMMESWAPASVLKRSGAAGGAQTNFGFRLIHVDSGDVGEFYSSDSSYAPYITLVYETNLLPLAPTLDYPTGGARILPLGNMYLTHNDPNGDAAVTLEVQVSTDSSFATVTHWNLVNDPKVNWGVTFGTLQHFRAYGGSALTRGTTYWWRARTADAYGYGPWSGAQAFSINVLPVAAKVRPTASQFAYIHNLEEPAVWTSGGAHAKPQLQWSFSDANGGAQSSHRVRIYSASVGGTTLFDSGKLTGGSPTSLDANVALVMGTEYWWTIELWDDVDESSGESSRTAFKMRWGQAIYEHNAGAGSSGWAFSSAGVVSGEGGFAFAAATGASGTGRGAWMASIGDVTPNAYLNVLVRIQPLAAPGTTPQLPDMSFTYLGSASTPDRWAVAGGGAMVLDGSVKRYGTQSLKFTTAAAQGYLYPYRKTAGDEVPVQPNTNYVASVWVRTNALFSNDLRITIYAASGDILFTGTAANGGLTRDTRSFPESWQRLTLAFKTGPTTTLIRPVLHYLGATAGEVFWVDGWKLEEGTVATAWTPGFVADAVVLDSNGIAVDASAGGIFRARGSAGGSRDQFELGPHGLLFTDVELWSPAAETLQIGDGLNTQNLIIEGDSSGFEGGELILAGAGSNADWHIDNGGGNFRVFDAAERFRVSAVSPQAQVFGDFQVGGHSQVNGQLDATGAVNAGAGLFENSVRLLQPAGLRIQTGTASLVYSASALSAALTVTFPVAFSGTPFIVATATDQTGAVSHNIGIHARSTTQFTLQGREVRESAVSITLVVSWIAIGPA